MLTKNKMERYVRVADAGDNAASTFVNFGVKKKPAGTLKRNRILLVCGYVLFGVLYAMFFLGMLGVPIKLPMGITFLPLLIWIAVFFTWRYVSVECEYQILDGEMRAMEIYGSKNMRELCRVRVSAMEKIAPYRDEYKAEADAIPENCRCACVSSMDAPDLYYAIFTDKDSDRCVLFFEATEKTLKVLRYYNSETVMSKTRY